MCWMNDDSTHLPGRSLAREKRMSPAAQVFPESSLVARRELLSCIRKAPMNVLIADDNDASCKLLRAFLEAEGHAVLVAADGHEALEILKDYPVDAIISDLLMPNLDGF